MTLEDNVKRIKAEKHSAQATQENQKDWDRRYGVASYPGSIGVFGRYSISRPLGQFESLVNQALRLVSSWEDGWEVAGPNGTGFCVVLTRWTGNRHFRGAANANKKADEWVKARWAVRNRIERDGALVRWFGFGEERRSAAYWGTEPCGYRYLMLDDGRVVMPPETRYEDFEERLTWALSSQ